MKIKALINCTGEGYENLTAGEEREVSAEVGKLLASYGYAEILEQVGNAEELTADCIKDCVEAHIVVLEREKLATEEKTGLETKSYEEVKETAKNLGISVFGVSKENLIQKITEINK